MLYVVCYDISDDRLRQRLSGRLLDFGVRVQESVFECLLEPGQYEQMLTALERVPLAELDSLRVYRICANCAEAIRIYGPAEVTQDPAFYVV